MDGGSAIDNRALTAFVDEIEHQFDERKVITEALGAIYERAKAAGFVPAFLRQMVKERQMEAEERSARYETLDEYRHALGLYADTPLGKAAMRSAEVIPHPKPFAQQPVHRARRSRKVLFDQEHPDGAPAA